MNWDALAAIAQAIAAIAVLVTLIYLARQVREARKMLQVGAHQSRTDRNIQILLSQATDPTYMAIREKVRLGEELSEQEINHASVYWLAFMRHLEDLHYQRKAGVIDDDTWDANLAGIRASFEAAWSKRLWRDRHRIFRKSFVDLVNETAFSNDA